MDIEKKNAVYWPKETMEEKHFFHTFFFFSLNLLNGKIAVEQTSSLTIELKVKESKCLLCHT